MQPRLVQQIAGAVRDGEPRLGRTRLVCVDGPAGSGKTTMADALGVALGAQVVHLDDLYEGWGGLPGMWPRLQEWVLGPLGRGEPGRYRRWDWDADRWAEWHDVPVADALVVEGVGAAQRDVDAVVTLRVWVEAPWELRLRRGVERDGEALRGRWVRWQQDEAAHFERERTRDRADVLVDGSGETAARWRA